MISPDFTLAELVAYNKLSQPHLPNSLLSLSPSSLIRFFSIAICMSNNTTSFLRFICLITIAFFATHKIFGHDPREPPLAPQSIPIIGHMIGLSRRKFNYYIGLRYARGFF